MAAPKKDVDWESIEIEYRAGTKPLKLIGAQYGVSDAGIIKRAKKEGWVRDLQAPIREKAQQKVELAVANAAGKAKNEQQVIEVNAEVQKDIILSHREDVGRARRLVMSMLEELEETTNSKEFISQLIELMRAPDENGVDKINDLLNKVMALPSRAGTMKSLSDSLKNLIALEREAFGVGEKGRDISPIDEAVRRALSNG
jgi:DNA-binding cell septation regulator SpoVG